MGTSTENAVFDFFKRNEYASPSVIDEFQQRLKAEGDNVTFNAATLDFIANECPNCGAVGLFRFHFLGKLKHPDCNTEWCVRPGTYALRQLRSVVYAGASFGSDTADSAKKKGEKGVFEGIFGFIVGAIFRLVLAITLIPIQAVVSLIQSKPVNQKPTDEKSNHLEDS